MHQLSYPTTTGVYSYFDKVQFWVHQPLNPATLAALKEQCGRGGIHADNNPARFDFRYRQRIELKQPSEDALRWLAGHDDALINRLEIAIDYVFENQTRKDVAFEFLHRHIVRRWHGRNQAIKLVSGKRENKRQPRVVDEIQDGETRYDAYRAPNKIVIYRNKHSRITGELHCLHLEWHLNLLKTVRGVGILSGQDLVEYDHRAFWEKRLLLRGVDPERLGRLIRNRRSGTKSRDPKIKMVGRHRYNIDRMTGTVAVRLCSTVQQLIDRVGKECRIERALIPISNEELLPDQRS